MYLTQEKQQELLPLLQEQASYDPRTGSILIYKDERWSSTQSHLTIRGFLHRVPQKLAAWLLSEGTTVPDGYEILCRNLDEQDFTRFNLILVQKEDYSRINRLVCNARNHFRLIEHSTDNFKVLVKWIDFDTGIRRKKVFEDSVIARQFIKKNLRNLMKELERLGVNLEEAELFLNPPRL